jgi:hypothetical protein
MTNESTPRTEPTIPGDCLGLRGLPDTRIGLDALVADLLTRMQTSYPQSVASSSLVLNLGLDDTRALRLLIAYARIHWRRHEIVGVPGEGYRWGGEDPAIYKAAGNDVFRRARCYLFLASLYRRQGTATAIAQLALDAIGHRTGIEAYGHRPNDDLAALVAAEGVGVGDVLDALIGELAASEEGRQALERAGTKHAEVLMPKAVVDDIIRGLDDMRRRLLGGVAKAG